MVSIYTQFSNFYVVVQKTTRLRTFFLERSIYLLMCIGNKYMSKKSIDDCGQKTQIFFSGNVEIATKVGNIFVCFSGLE